MAAIAEMRSAIDGNLVVVSHGLTLQALITQHLRLPAGVGLPDKLGNTSITIAGAEPPHHISLLNCTRHLQGDLGDDARAAVV